jgi:hypothetical protein
MERKKGDEKAKSAARRDDARPSSEAWHGEEVADAPGDQAERDADFGAGRAPGPAREEELASDELTEPRRMSPDDERENQEEKREAAAGDHADDRAAGVKRSPKSL